MKDLPGRTGSDKLLHDNAVYIAKHFKYDGYHCRLTSMVYKFLDKESASASTHTGTGLHFENQQLTFRKFK